MHESGCNIGGQDWVWHRGEQDCGCGTLEGRGMVSVQQVSKEDKLVDSKCHKLTASFQRKKHQRDARVPVCSFYEVRTI